MQQVIKCRHCGIEVSIDTSLKIAQACPNCQTVLAVVSSPGDTRQASPVSGQPPRQQSPQQQSPNPTGAQPGSLPQANPQGHFSQQHHVPVQQVSSAPDPYTPAPGQSQHMSGHLQHFPQAPSQTEKDYLTPKPRKPKPTHSNGNKILWTSVFGGALALTLIVVVIVLILRGGTTAIQAGSGVAASTIKPEYVDSASDFSSFEYKSLPNLRVASATKGSLAYDWNSLSSTTYRFNYSMQSGGDRFDISGTNQLSAAGGQPNLSVGELTEGGTGTCFFIHPDGLAVTCAHVVEGAEVVEVRVRGHWQKATVVDLDAKNDLALLKISRGDMPVIPLASSKDLELAQSIHIVGYPIQDVLGSSVKFNSGAITGFKNENGASEILFDANINPGNSGGPLIDQSGNVVGVASAMLQGDGLNSVALAVKSDRVFDLLRANKINIPVSRIDEPKDKNSDLAKMTTPAVCLVKTAGRSGLQMIRHRTQISLGNVGGSTTLQGQMLVDQSGEVVQFEEESGGGVSIFLLSPATVGIEKLNLYAGDNWQYRGASIIALPQVQTKFVPVVPEFSRRGRFGVRPYGSPQIRPETETSVSIVLGMETINYTKRSEDDRFATIGVVKTVQSLQQDPSSDGYMTSQLTGTMKYDKQMKRISEMNLTGSMTFPISGRPTTFSVKYDFSIGAGGFTGNTTNNPPGYQPGSGKSNPGIVFGGRPPTKSVPTLPKTKLKFTDVVTESEINTRISNYDKSPAQRKWEESNDSLYWITEGRIREEASMAFSPNSNFLFCAHSFTLYVFDLKKKKLVFKSERLREVLKSIAVLKRSNKILVGDMSGTIRVIDYDDQGKLTQVHRLRGADLGVNKISVSDDDKTILTCNDLAAHIWNIEGTGPRNKIDLKYIKAVGINSSRNSGFLYSESNSSVVEIDLATGANKKTMKVLGDWHAAFSPDGTRFAVKDDDIIREWDLTTYRKSGTYTANGLVTSIQYHPQTSSLFSNTSQTDWIDQWSVETQEKIDKFELNSQKTCKIVVSPNGKFVAGSSWRNAYIFTINKQ